MVDILHRVGVQGVAPERAYEALTTVDGLAAWWTVKTSGDPGQGGTVEFRFPQGGFDMRVLEADPGRLVLWEVVEGPAEWVGTTVRFELRREGEYAVVLFTHAGWREPVEFMHHCSTKWATFLMSLKQLLETGRGAPSPEDVRVDEWD